MDTPQPRSDTPAFHVENCGSRLAADPDGLAGKGSRSECASTSGLAQWRNSMLKRTVLVGFLILTSFAWAAQSKDEVNYRLDSATKVLREIMNAPDKGIPEEVLDGAKCVAVVPHMIKGGLVFGAQHGRGIATCRLSKGRWSAPAFFALTGGSWGAQIGAEGVDLVMMIMNEKGMRHVLESQFQIGADASAAAGPVGRHAAAGTD